MLVKVETNISSFIVLFLTFTLLQILFDSKHERPKWFYGLDLLLFRSLLHISADYTDTTTSSSQPAI